MFETPDHPVIRNLERTGYPDGKEPTYPRCPICDAECDTIYRNKELDIVGCDVCITKCPRKIIWSSKSQDDGLVIVRVDPEIPAKS